MATVRRDYYDVLGVSRSASEKEIKSAFRKLARELHPDVSEEAGAEERFREAAEAYEVLSRGETRELYDRFGHEGLRTGGFRPTQFDFANIADLFSVFFGDELFGMGRGASRRGGRGADVLAEVTIDLEEAARIDGASRLSILLRIVVPLSLPALATLAVIQFLWTWNDFLWPLVTILTNQDAFTLQLGLATFQGSHQTQWHLVAAANLMSMVPMIVLFLLAQRYFVRGIATQGLKG